MTPVEKVLEAVDRYEERSNGLWCECPCEHHEDHDPSLHVEEASDGSALLVCRAGCPQEEVLAALEARGLNRRDLFTGGDVVALNGHSRGARRSSTNGGDRLAASYPIEDASGRVTAIHERHEGPSGKRFSWKHPDGRPSKRGEIKTAALPLYGSERVADWPAGHGIVLVEGEKPTDALRELGIRAVGTVTGAGGTPSADSLRVLDGRRVILWPDDDLPGREHMRRVAERLTGIAAEVRWFEWEGPSGIKGPDAADHPAIRSGERADVEELARELREAPAWRPGAGKEQGDHRLLLEGRELIGARLAGGIEPPEELLTGILLAGKLHKIFSGPGAGKTFLALWISLEIVRLGKTVLYLDAENGPGVVAERLEDLGAEPMPLDRSFHYYPSPDLSTDADALTAYVATLDDVRPDLVVFDSWVDFLTLAGLEENNATEVTGWVHAFAAPAKARGAAVLLLDHVPTDANRSRGSTQKLGKVDVSWALKKGLDFDRRNVGQIELRLEKDREGWLPKRVRFAIGGGEAGFVFRKDAEVFEPPDPTDGLTDSQRKVLEYIEESGEEGARWKQIEADTGYSKSTLSDALRKLASSNLVDKDGSRYRHRSPTEPPFPVDTPDQDSSEGFDSGSIEPPEPGTSGGGSGGSVTFRDRTTEPGAKPGESEAILDDLVGYFADDGQDRV